MTFDWWTFGFQTVNVLVLVWLLRRFFWRPVASIIAARNADAKRVMEEAAAKQAQAHAALAEIEATRAGFKAEREKILADAHDLAEQDKIAAVKAARTESLALREAAKAANDRQTESARKAASDFASALAVTIAGRMAARLSGAAVEAAFQDWLIDSLTGMKPEERKALAEEPVLELVSARDVDPDRIERLTTRISRALGSDPKINFCADPELIEGFELRSPHFTLRNSWQADLDRIRHSLQAPTASVPSNGS